MCTCNHWLLSLCSRITYVNLCVLIHILNSWTIIFDFEWGFVYLLFSSLCCLFCKIYFWILLHILTKEKKALFFFTFIFLFNLYPSASRIVYVFAMSTLNTNRKYMCAHSEVVGECTHDSTNFETLVLDQGWHTCLN